MTKLVGTRIRVEKSDIKTNYFPEYCLESKGWFGKVKQQWYGVEAHSSDFFGEAYRMSKELWLTEAWAKEVIDLAIAYNKQNDERNWHDNTKETTYFKYP